MVLRTGMLVARVSSRGCSTMRCAPAACGAAEAAAGVLAAVPFAQGVRGSAALVAVVGGTVLRAVVVFARASCGFATMPVGFAACGVAVPATCVLGIIALDEFFDDFGVEEVV